MKLFLYILTITTLSTHFLIANESVEQKYHFTQGARAYLDEALSIMEHHAVNRHHLDWTAIRAQVYQEAMNAKSTQDTYEAIRLALSLLQENHSFFRTPDQEASLMRSDDRAVEIITQDAKLLDHQIGYLHIPGNFTSSDKSLKEYAKSIQDQIQELDKHHLNKWIVDLRDNSGGAFSVMLLGLKPLIDANPMGFFTDASGKQIEAWNFLDDSFTVNNEIYNSLDTPSYQLNQPQPWIAVLVDHETGSAGEFAAMGFIGDPKVRVFGQKTAGYTTGNSYYPMNDGAALILATSYGADRTGKVYLNGIEPDHVTEIGEDTLQAAVQWLNRH